jgi:hypothetical protein
VLLAVKGVFCSRGVPVRITQRPNSKTRRSAISPAVRETSPLRAPRSNQELHGSRRRKGSSRSLHATTRTKYHANSWGFRCHAGWRNLAGKNPTAFAGQSREIPRRQSAPLRAALRRGFKDPRAPKASQQCCAAESRVPRRAAGERATLRRGFKDPRAPKASPPMTSPQNPTKTAPRARRSRSQNRLNNELGAPEKTFPGRRPREDRQGLEGPERARTIRRNLNDVVNGFSCAVRASRPVGGQDTPGVLGGPDRVRFPVLFGQSGGRGG